MSPRFGAFSSSLPGAASHQLGRRTFGLVVARSANRQNCTNVFLWLLRREGIEMDHAASRLPHRLAPALALGLAFLPLASRADIAGYPEASEEVRVYRALEKQFMARDEAKEMFRFVPGTNCPHSESPLPPQASWEISIISSDSPSPPFKVRTYTRCGIDVATLCAEGRVAMDVFSDGRWAWTMSRIGYIKYYRDLSKRVAFPYFTRSLIRRSQLKR